MEIFYLAIRGDVLSIEVNLLKATVNETAKLRNLLEEEIVLGHSKLVVDLSKCTHLDSTFIGVLVITYKKLLANGGELKLVEPLEPAKGLFHLTGVSKVFDTFEADKDALWSFNKEPKIREYALVQ